MSGVENISNQQDMINTISKFVGGVRVAGLILFAVFTGVSIFLITNTTKITVYTRRKEVGIMKFVGATDWFIRWPFVIEGAVIGLLGTITANTLLYYIYKTAFVKINENLLLANLLPTSYVTQTLQWQLLLVGILIGGLGSSLSLYKFLKV